MCSRNSIVYAVVFCGVLQGLAKEKRCTGSPAVTNKDDARLRKWVLAGGSRMRGAMHKSPSRKQLQLELRVEMECWPLVSLIVTVRTSVGKRAEITLWRGLGSRCGHKCDDGSELLAHLSARDRTAMIGSPWRKNEFRRRRRAKRTAIGDGASMETCRSPHQ